MNWIRQNESMIRWALGTVFIAGLFALQAWGDKQWVNETKATDIATKAASAAVDKIEPDLRIMRAHVSNESLHADDDQYVTRREFDLILSTLTRIERKLEER